MTAQPRKRAPAKKTAAKAPAKKAAAKKAPAKRPAKRVVPPAPPPVQHRHDNGEVEPETPRPRRRRRRIGRISFSSTGMRDFFLFFFGLGGVVYETVAVKTDRPTLLLLFAAMMGLPAFLRTDEHRK